MNALDELRELLHREFRLGGSWWTTKTLQRYLDDVLDAFAAAHRLIDITICGPQCPACRWWGSESAEATDCWSWPPHWHCSARMEPAPTGKPCIWKLNEV